eukprot:2623819-Amphidinium_carterae.1
MAHSVHNALYRQHTCHLQCDTLLDMYNGYICHWLKCVTMRKGCDRQCTTGFQQSRGSQSEEDRAQRKKERQ